MSDDYMDALFENEEPLKRVTTCLQWSGDQNYNNTTKSDETKIIKEVGG